MTFATATGAKPSNFTLIVTVLIAGTIFFGFGFTVYPDLLARLRPAVLYVHALTAAAWLALLVAQVMLVRNRRFAQHRKVGTVGLWLGAVVSVTAFATALVLRHDSVISHGADRMAERIAFLSIPLNGFIGFSVALALAALWRKRPAVHRRAMMIAAISLMGAGISRIPVLGELPYFGDVAPDLVLLLLCARDYWTERRVHPVYLIGLPLFVAVQQGSAYLYE